MDWDDVETPKADIIVGEDLSKLSVSELENRIEALQSEIERVNLEIAAKRKHEEAASAVFKP